MNTETELKSWKSRTAVVATAVFAATVAAWFSLPTTNASATDVVVYKTPYCECCVKWIAHMRDHGFDVQVVNVPNTEPTQKRLGVPRQLGSCHTATVGDYWVEGHVPADLVQQLLTEQSDDVAGIAVPGMVMGSPGMEGPNPVRYEVLALGTDGHVTVYASRRGHSSPQ